MAMKNLSINQYTAINFTAVNQHQQALRELIGRLLANKSELVRPCSYNRMIESAWRNLFE
jgi:hypothetical protein